MSEKQDDKPVQRSDDDLTEAEIAARFESTVRRMANTKPTGAKRPRALSVCDPDEKPELERRETARQSLQIEGKIQ